MIEDVLSCEDELPSYPCEASTAYRIRMWFFLLRSYLESALEALKLLYKHNRPLFTFLGQLHLSRLQDQPAGWLKSLVRIVVNSGYWKQTRSA